jgi:peptidyl-prolyl cis-trans isomerase SurA
MRRLPLIVTGLAALAIGSAAAEQLVDGIAAQVGSDIVLVSEVMQMVGPVEQQLRAQGVKEQDIAKLRAEGLERMIEWRLIEQVVRQSELYASDEEVDSAIDTIAAQNRISREQLQQSVTAHGLSYDDYRDQIKRELERRKVVNAMVGSRVHVEEEDVRRLYDERFADQPEGGVTIRVRQVLVTFGEEGRSKEAACAEVVAARERIAAGEPFENVASQVSEVAPERGGDIGWLHWDTAAAWMREVVGQLEPGQTSGVLQLPSACCIVQLADRRDYQPISYEEAKPRLQEELYERQMASAFDEWIEKLRENTYIERKGYFADAAKFVKPPAPETPETSAGAPESLLP